MKKITTLIALLMAVAAFAQNKPFDVIKFEKKENDMDARINAKQDKNDKTCALIKIETTRNLREFTFDGVVDSKQKDGEIWVFLPPGTRYFTIRCNTIKNIPENSIEYQFGEQLEEAKVYAMTLKTPPKEEDKATLYIHLDNDISAVEVRVNGQLKGTAPVTVAGFAKEKKTVQWEKTRYRRVTKTIELAPGYNEISATLRRSHINGFQMAAEGLVPPDGKQWGGNFVMDYRFNAYLSLGVGGGYHSYSGENSKGTVIPGFVDFRVNMLPYILSPYLAVAGGVCFDRYTNTDTYIDLTGTVEKNSEHQTLYIYYHASAGLHLRCSDVFALFAGAGYNNMAGAVVIQAGLSVTFMN
jgi:hypothetical protein